MSSPAAGALREAYVAALTLNGVMLLAALAMFSVPVMAPAIAVDLAIDPALVGAYSAILWASSIVTSVGSGRLIARFGPFAMSQACVAVCALGAAVIAIGALPAFVVAAILIGLAHGVETPASSTLLARITPAAQQPLVFSVKQTGVQLGGIASGFVFPAMALALGWQTTALVLAAFLAAAAIALEPARRRHDAGGHAAGRLSFGEAFARVVRDRRLRALSLASFAFVAAQVCFNTFLVSFFVRDVGTSLALAGTYLAAGQLGGLVGRLLWGAISGRALGAAGLLMLLGLGMCGASLAVGLAAQVLPTAAVAAVCFAGGLTVSGWNGVFLAEIARLAPQGEVARITGASFLIGSCGLVLGPVAFSLLAAATSFGTAFVGMAFLALAGSLVLVPVRGGRRL